MSQAQFGLTGLGVMGSALVRNIADKGFSVAVHNRDPQKVDDFLSQYGSDSFVGAKTYEELAGSLETPRKILLLVPAGDPVDQVIAELTPHLEKGDIIIDGGNSFFKDTIRREKELSEKGIHFVGSGVSGGEEGALKGPSIMPGGSDHAWKSLKDIFEAIAARDFSGGPCVTHVGTDGAGHFVKMVHNGIEYGVMQLIAEVYDIYRKVYELSPAQIADIFEGYNAEQQQSFLVEIAVPILRTVDPDTDTPLIDLILDTAGQKGTGRWTIIEALELGVATPTITAATVARVVSAYKDLRAELSMQYERPVGAIHELPLQDAKHVFDNAMYAATLASYAEGFEIIKAGAAEYGWNIDYKEVSRIWEGGCIIRAQALKILSEAFTKHSDIPPHLFAVESIKKILTDYTVDWQSASRVALESGVSTPALHASLNYFLGMTTEQNPANMIQGLRDYFGAHTYQRTDKDGTFHTEWTGS